MSSRGPILIIDHGLGAATILERAFRNGGHDVTRVVNDADALSAFPQNPPRATFVEFDADVKPRLALIRRFRKIDARASVIAVASCEEMPALGLLRDLGITEVLTHAKEWVRVGIAPAPRPARIFVLDDEPTIVALLSRFLGSRGYEVQGACSGPDALKQLPDHQPDVLLFDLLMPGMTGLDVLRALRDMGFAGTGIALSAAQDDVLLRRLVNLAPVHLVGKPVDLERLALLLEAVLAIRSQA